MTQNLQLKHHLVGAAFGGGIITAFLVITNLKSFTDHTVVIYVLSTGVVLTITMVAMAAIFVPLVNILIDHFSDS